ncbi:hypothetical protein PAESOLCIP111_00412 [Paenibacillus solanacearum]|uniref:Uncharacterized protein n=1 Tax=Paenibacillus solanacearum TaxID=2048548 RepID=A0A916JTY2_9BACL|nr:hypothetical protein [Paenibacillus solanacearum]CAG7600606.1 hypothetical protein PAESOLCIP111_00412 [Paenibacillus solanacearum]
MTNKRSSHRKEDTAPVNKSALLVSIFMATALVGCGEASPKPQLTQVNPTSQSAVKAQPSDSSETALAPETPPYGGTERDYCQDANNDGTCDDSGESYDKQYAYTEEGHTYYGRSASVSAGILAAGALAGAALGAAAMTAGKPAPPVVPSSPPAVSQPYKGPGAAPQNEKTPAGGTSAPTTSARSGSFNTGSTGSQPPSSGISSGTSASKGGIGSSSSSSGSSS